MYIRYHYSIIILFCSLFANVQSPSLFQYNQGSYQAFYFFKNVTIDSIKVSSDDWVGTFNCTKWNKDSTACATLGPCVGARIWNTRLCGGGICDLPAIGIGSESLEDTKGYLDKGEFPAFLIYDNDRNVYYKTAPNGNVKIQKDQCRNGYPYCYGWENHGFYLIDTLDGIEIYMDCNGKLDGSAVKDDCGICGGSGPQYHCKKNGQSYCSEHEYEQKCIP